MLSSNVVPSSVQGVGDFIKSWCGSGFWCLQMTETQLDLVEVKNQTPEEGQEYTRLQKLPDSETQALP